MVDITNRWIFLICVLLSGLNFYSSLSLFSEGTTGILCGIWSYNIYSAQLHSSATGKNNNKTNQTTHTHKKTPDTCTKTTNTKKNQTNHNCQYNFFMIRIVKNRMQTLQSWTSDTKFSVIFSWVHLVSFHSYFLLVDLFLPYLYLFLILCIPPTEWLTTFVLSLPVRHFALPFRLQLLTRVTLKSKVSPHYNSRGSHSNFCSSARAGTVFRVLSKGVTGKTKMGLNSLQKLALNWHFYGLRTSWCKKMQTRSVFSLPFFLFNHSRGSICFLHHKIICFILCPKCASKLFSQGQ